MQDLFPHDNLEHIFGETEYPTDPFEMNKVSKDDMQKRFDISLLLLCCMYNIHDLNGRLFEDVKVEITCTINLSCQGQGVQNHDFDMHGNAWQKFKWKDNLKEQFINSFATLFAQFKIKLSRSNESIVNFLHKFIKIYINAGKIWHVSIGKKSDVETSHPGGMQTVSWQKRKNTHC